MSASVLPSLNLLIRLFTTCLPRSPTYPKQSTILGINQVANLIKGLLLREAIGGNEVAYEKFWERSNEIALLCAIIAKKQISACNIAVDQAYMADYFMNAACLS